MIYIGLLVILSLMVAIYFICKKPNVYQEMRPPKLENNPSLDVIVTETTPTITFFNGRGGSSRFYEVEIDTSNDFSSKNIKKFTIKESDKHITKFKIDSTNALLDKKRYFWRARSVSNDGQKSVWANSRFFINTASDDKFSGLSRIGIKNIKVSAGYNINNIVDYDDPGLGTFWQSPPPAPGRKEHWIELELEKQTQVNRMWIMSNPQGMAGWLKEFYLQYSNDGKKWIRIKETWLKDNDSFRNIIDFKDVKAKYLRLVIKKYHGYAAQINEILFFTSKKPKTPNAPKNDYVLIIGDEHNGYTFTELAKHIESLGQKIETLSVPHYEASWEMVQKLSKKPIAIVLSGNNADYSQLPMFEYNGVFEIIRNSDIPILGICAGHQFLAMAYGYTRAASMGWSDISAIKPLKKMTHIKTLQDDPIFEGIADNFLAPEIHGWSVMEPAEEFKVIAQSTYIQAQKSNKRLIYGVQFHPEIDVDYNQAGNLIENFLKIVKKDNDL